MQLRLLLFCAATLGVGFFASPARADDDSEEASSDADKSDESEETKPDSEDEPDDERAAKGKASDAPRFEISVTTTLASYTKLSYTLDMPVVGKLDGAISNSVLGPSANPVTVEFGYLLSSQLSLGLLLEAGSTYTEIRADARLGINQSQTLGRLMVGPRASFLFSDSGALRPFIMAAVGFTYAPQHASADAQSLALSGFEVIGGLGLHWFLAPSFSIDVAGRAGFGLGSGRVDQEWQMGDTTSTLNVPVTGSLVTGGALIGLTGWLP